MSALSYINVSFITLYVWHSLRIFQCYLNRCQLTFPPMLLSVFFSCFFLKLACCGGTNGERRNDPFPVSGYWVLPTYWGGGGEMLCNIPMRNGLKYETWEIMTINKSTGSVSKQSTEDGNWKWGSSSAILWRDHRSQVLTLQWPCFCWWYLVIVALGWGCCVVFTILAFLTKYFASHNWRWMKFDTPCNG